MTFDPSSTSLPFAFAAFAVAALGAFLGTRFDDLLDRSVRAGAEEVDGADRSATERLAGCLEEGEGDGRAED
jgi:hypothetical protein